MSCPEKKILKDFISPSGVANRGLSVTEAVLEIQKKFSGQTLPNMDETIVKETILKKIFRAAYYGNLINTHQFVVRIFLSGVSDNLGQQIGARLIGARFGACHAGIQIGETVLNWYDNSLVQIAPWGNNSDCFVLFSPPKNSAPILFTEEIAHQLSQVIIKWNATKKYSVLGANCHDFVVDVFQSVFGIDPFPRGLLGHKIKKLIRGDTSRSLTTKFAGKLVFNTHDELDRIESDADIQSKLNDEERSVLKVFHRAFQMVERHEGIDRHCCLGCATGIEEFYSIPVNGNL